MSGESITIACYVLHYGAEWLEYSIRSVAESVDKFMFVYTGAPSFGHMTDLKCPESQDQLFDISRRTVLDYDGKSWDWHDVSGMHLSNEGAHRTYANNQCWKDGASTILVVDADEIWIKDELDAALYASQNLDARTFRVRMRHMWRSMRWVCDDPAAPTRIIRHPGKYSQEENYIGACPFHMGYAQSSRLIQYKMSIHGHKAEIRPGWFENIFMPWSVNNPYGDVHPTCENGFWNPKLLEAEGLDVLQGLTTNHPYWDLEIIP